jgi:lysophospholipase L1-like esterase
MADTDKLVKVGQLDTVVDEIVNKFGETNGRLDDVKEVFSTITNSATDSSLWEQGSINVTNGENANSSVRIRTGFLPTNIVGIFVNTGFPCGVLCWDSTDTYVGSWNGSTFSKSTTTFYEGYVNFEKLIGTYKIKLYAKNTAGTAIAVADSSNIAFSALTDGTLTKQYIPADAKETGDAINEVRDSVIAVNSPFVKLTKSSDIFTVEEGYYATTGNKIALAGYVLCSYVAEQDFQIYANAETIAGQPALFVSIYNNSIASGNNVACYKRSDGTLPTEANKATVYAGQILAISIYSPSTSPADFGIYANYYTNTTLADGVLLNDSQIQQVLDKIPGGETEKFTNFARGKKIAWFGDSISELKSLPHITGSLMAADVYDCSIRGSTIGRTYSNYDTFSFYNLVSAVISGDFSAQFAQLDAYEQAQGREYPGIRENLTTLSTLDFDEIDYVVLLQGTNDFGITAVHAATGYTTKVDEMKARMDDAISRFITAYPKLKFYIISPPFRATPTEDYYGDTLADYISAEQEVAEKYAIAFYNLLINSRICDANKTTYMNSDGGVYVHPNDYGDAWLAELSAKFISVN